MRYKNLISAMAMSMGVLTAPVALADLNDGLVAYYPFNGNAQDESGNGNDGTVNGATLVEDRLGNAESAYQFNKGNVQISALNSDSLDITGSVTMVAWFRSDDGGGIVGKGTYGSTGLGYELHVNRTTDRNVSYRNTVAVNCYDSSRRRFYVNTLDFVGRQNYNDGQWHHVVGICDAEGNGKVRLYLDGALIGESSNSITNIGSVDLPLLIGNRNNALPFDGDLDEVRIYNRALSECEIQSLYATQVPECSDAQVDNRMLTQLLRGCKTDPENGDYSWACDEPTRQEASEIKAATTAVFDAVCREDTVPDSNDVCLASQIYAFSWGGLLDELLNSNDEDHCSDIANPVVPSCQDAQVDRQTVLKYIRGCKADPENGDHSWVCDEPTRQEATEIKKATTEVFDAICRDDTVPELNNVCLASQIYSFSWGGQSNDTQPLEFKLGVWEYKLYFRGSSNFTEQIRIEENGRLVGRTGGSWNMDADGNVSIKYGNIELRGVYNGDGTLTGLVHDPINGQVMLGGEYTHSTRWIAE